jgi:DNA repair protein RadC
MTGSSVSVDKPPTAEPPWTPRLSKPRCHRVRELICAYRPVRDREGRIISVSSLALNTPQVAAQIIAPLLADQPVEMFAVACLSARNRILAWHVVSRGTRSSTPVSIPDVFVPACVTPGTVSLLVAHNHPSGDPTPSTDDLVLTTRMVNAGEIMGIDVVDHVILADQRYFSLVEAGRLAPRVG